MILCGVSLWLAFVGFVFWHDASKHPSPNAEDMLVLERTVRLLAPLDRIGPDTLRRITYPTVSRSNGRTCVTLSPYRPHRRGGGRACYAAGGKVVETRISAVPFGGRSFGERLADAMGTE